MTNFGFNSKIIINFLERKTKLCQINDNHLAPFSLLKITLQSSYINIKIKAEIRMVTVKKLLRSKKKLVGQLNDDSRFNCITKGHAAIQYTLFPRNVGIIFSKNRACPNTSTLQ